MVALCMFWAGVRPLRMNLFLRLPGTLTHFHRSRRGSPQWLPECQDQSAVVVCRQGDRGRSPLRCQSDRCCITHTRRGSLPWLPFVCSGPGWDPAPTYESVSSSAWHIDAFPSLSQEQPPVAALCMFWAQPLRMNLFLRLPGTLTHFHRSRRGSPPVAARITQ